MACTNITNVGYWFILLWCFSGYSLYQEPPRSHLVFVFHGRERHDEVLFEHVEDIDVIGLCFNQLLDAKVSLLLGLGQVGQRQRAVDAVAVGSLPFFEGAEVFVYILFDYIGKGGVFVGQGVVRAACRPSTSGVPIWWQKSVHIFLHC